MGTCAALLLGATLASAQNADRTTTVTFSAPVALPGVTLPAGSYLFKLADSQVNRNIVQVFDKDRSKIFATIIAIPAQRNEPADETVITFNEAPANAAPAIRYWYYPGEKSGQEFAYPKKQAIEIANAAHTSVLSVDAENADSMKSGEISRVEPGAAATAQAVPPAEQPANAPVAAQPAQPEQPAAPPSTDMPKPAQPEAAAPAPAEPAPAAAAPSSSTEPQAVGTSGTAPRESLPKTGSTLPLVGLAGLLALISAFGVRAMRRVRA
jgi:LPXTG-motif cell wall-anchored protein